MCKGSGRHKLCLVTERASELLPADLSLIWKNRHEETASLLILFVPIQMLQFSARLSAEPWERAPPSSMCRGIAALLICISLWLQREREKHEALPPAHVHKMSQSSPKSIFSLPSPPCWSVSMGHFQVGERLQLSVVAILGMLFYRLDLLWFGRNERVWHKISKSKTQTGSFSGDFSMWVFFFFSRRDFL